MGASADKRQRRRGQPFRLDDLRLGAIQAKALAQGGTRKGRHGVEWNVAGKGRDRCIQPRLVHLLVHEGLNTPVGPSAYLEARCRNCEPCLKARAAFWKFNAMREIESATRTWFVTLTVAPEHRVRTEYAAARRMDLAGISDRSPKVVFGELLKVLGPEVTRFLKRLRKASGAQLRYLLVWEDHVCECCSADGLEKSRPGHFGFPHAHLLIHERSGQVTKRDMEGQWRLGFSKPKLVDVGEDGSVHRHAAYVTKYISKSMLTRVRASLKYGGRT